MNGSQLHLSSPTQVLDIEFTRNAAARIHASLKQKQAASGLSRNEILSVSRVVDFYACCEQWDSIVDVSSRAIIAGVGINAQLKLYRSWAEGLRGNHDVEGLQTLAKHLLNHARTNHNFAALSLVCLIYAGRSGLTKFLFTHLKRSQSKSQVVVEALSLYLCESVEKHHRTKGVRLYAHLVKNQKNYFTSLNYATYAFENEDFEHATTAMDALNKAFPLSPLPHITAAQIAYSQKQYSSTLKSLQTVLDCNPNHTDVILVFAQCLEKMGDVLAAKRFLAEKEDLFDIADCDFSSVYGSILEKCAARYENNFDKNQAINHYAAALKTCQKLHLPEAQLHIKLADISAGVMENKIQSSKQDESKYWILAVDDKTAPSILSHESLLMRCPAESKKGDIVFIARHKDNDKTLHIEAVFKFSSNIVPDSYFGNAARLDGRRLFEHAIEYRPETTQQSLDSYHVQNFSETNYARYNEISHSVAEKIVERVEAMNTRNQTHRKAV